jgi:uncharacterized protein YjbI with pentapeptide repeats
MNLPPRKMLTLKKHKINHFVLLLLWGSCTLGCQKTPSSDPSTPTPAAPNMSRTIQKAQNKAKKLLIYDQQKFHPRLTPEGRKIEGKKKILTLTQNLPALRQKPKTYYNAITLLNQMLEDPHSPHGIILETLERELLYSLENEQNLSADWSKTPLRQLDLRGKNLSGTNITGSQLNDTHSLEGTILSKLNLAGFDPTQKNLRNADLSETKNLRTDLLHKASNLQGANLSQLALHDFNVGEVCLQKVNLSQTIGVNLRQLSLNPSVQYINLSHLDLKHFNPQGKDLTGVNFSYTTNLNTTALSQALNLENANLSFIDLKGFSPYGLNLNGVNFTSSKNLNAQALSRAASLENTTFFGVDLQGFKPKNRSLRGANFSGSQNLSAKALAQAKNLEGAKVSGTQIKPGELRAELKKARKNPDTIQTITF